MSEYEDNLGGHIARRRAKANKAKGKAANWVGSPMRTFIPPEPPDDLDDRAPDPLPNLDTEPEHVIRRQRRKSGGDKANLNADKRAEARGCYVVNPQPNELFIDIDREEDYEYFKKNVNWLKDIIECWHVSPSPSGKPGHYHIVVTLKRSVRDAFERIGLQAILGSDRLREVLSWRNAMNNSGRPTCFFEKETNLFKLLRGKTKSAIRTLFSRLVNK